MQVGDKITFSFGKDEKEGTVFKVFPKTIYIKVDFAKHKGKIIKRSIIEVQPGKETTKKKDDKKRKEEKRQGVTKKQAKKKDKEQKKTKQAKEDRKKEKAAQKSTQ